MDKRLKLTALQNLAKTVGGVAETAIKNELTKITAILQNATQYNNISDQLELLDAIVYRVPEKAITTIRDFLERLKALELTYMETPGNSLEQIRKYLNNYKLMKEALDVLEDIRYHRPSEVLDIFFEYSCYEEESVAMQAKHGIEKLAEYNLDIFCGDGKDWQGLGLLPQDEVLKKIVSFDEVQKKKYYSAIIIACKQMLSPTITGRCSTYKTITVRTSAIPVGVKEIRNKVLQELQGLYPIAKDFAQKESVLSVMEIASSTPNTSNCGNDVLAMIIEDSITVLKFMKSIPVSEDMQITQRIEHDAYSLFYRMGSIDKTIHEIALEIRDRIYADEEYLKFRILIGFKSIFHDWEKVGGTAVEDFDREEKYREEEALKLAETIDTVNYEEWKQRIIRYASIKSNDMAMFPYFGKFLEHFGKTSPELALKLISKDSVQMENFITVILCGIAETDHKKDVYDLIKRWCDEGKYLFSLTRFFEFSKEINEELLKKIFNKARADSNLITLNQIIFSVSEQYNEKTKQLIQKFFIPTLEILTSHKDASWIFGFWHRKQRSSIISNMTTAEHNTVLDNLLWLEEVDYHAEEILLVIAKESPQLVIEFFCKRVSMEETEEDLDGYDAIPFNFHKLSKPLSRNPEQAIDIVLSRYDRDNSGQFVFYGARLLKNIFPNLPSELQQKLLKLAQSRENKDLLFMIEMLRNYEGDPIIHSVCKEIIKILPDDSNLTSELSNILKNTGVVHGEYGYVDTYEQKIQEMQSWLQDENPKVKEFAQNYIDNLRKQIEYEKKRADEGIILRKHQYGSDED